MIPSWRARITRNPVKPLDIQDRTLFVEYLIGAFKEGQIVEIFVRKVTRIRSLPQNRYYWGVVIPAIMEWMGEDIDKDQVHFALKEKFLSNRDPNTGLVIVFSTTKLTVEQFREYIDRIIRFFAPIGLRIPDPSLANDLNDNVSL